MTAEEAEDLFWKSHGTEPWPVDKPMDTWQRRLQCWDVVLRKARKEYEEENERLRAENRDLKRIILETTEADAKRAA